jgi:hypothetical protein
MRPTVNYVRSKRKEYRIGIETKIFLSGLCLMVLFLVLGLNRVITTGDNAILNLLVAFSMVAGIKWVDLRKKRHK